MSSPKGFPSNQKLALPTEGQTNAFATVVPVDPYRHALDVPRFAFRVDNPTVPRTAGATTGNPSSGPTFVADTSTPAQIGDFVRFIDGAAAYLEVPIVAIAPGGNGFYLSARLDTPPVAGNEFFIMRYTTQRVDETGSQLVVASPGPSQFVLDGADVEVEEDTVTPANNKPFPTKVFSSNNAPINPATEETLGIVVEASGLNGAAANRYTPIAGVDAGNIDPIQSNGSGALLVQDDAAENSLDSIDLKTPNLGQAAMAASVPVVIANNQSAVPVTGPLTDTQLRASPVPVSASALPLPTGAATEVTLAAMSAKLPATLGQKASAASLAAVLSTEQEALIGALTETAPATDTASSGLNGRLQRIAQRITSLIALFPTTLGQKTAANSFAVVLASDQSAIATKAPVNTNGSGGGQTALTATTASSEAPPANAVGFILQADPANTDPIRFRIGGTASTVNGIQLEASRDSGYIPCAATVSICATASGTNKYCIQWILSS